MLKYLEGLAIDKAHGCSFLHQTQLSETAPLHTHDFYEIFLVINGVALHNINNELVLLKRGSLVFIRPDDVHCYNFYQNNTFEILDIGITQELFNRVQLIFCESPDFEASLSNILPPSICMAEHSTQAYIEYFNTLKTFLQRNDYIKARTFLSIFLIGCFNDYFLSPASLELEDLSVPANLLQTLRLMKEYKNFYVGLNRMIELSQYSQEYLNRQCKKYLHQTPTEIINNIRLDYVRDLLKNTDKKITDIYLSAGFNNASYFYQLFQNRFGCSPLEYRHTSLT